MRLSSSPQGDSKCADSVAESHRSRRIKVKKGTRTRKEMLTPKKNAEWTTRGCHQGAPPCAISTHVPSTSRDHPDLSIPLLTQLSPTLFPLGNPLVIHDPVVVFLTAKLKLHSASWRILASYKMVIFSKVRQNKVYAVLSFLLITGSSNN